jgi:subtilisin family serine protease
MARFVVSHRLAIFDRQKDAALRSSFANFARDVRSFAHIDAEHPGAEAGRRGLLVASGDARDFEAKRREVSPDILIEPELPRRPARYLLARSDAGLATAADASEPAAGIGAVLNLAIVQPGSGAPVAGAAVSVVITNYQSGKSIPMLAITDANGRISVVYNQNFWYPALVSITPRSEFWSCVAPFPQSGSTIPIMQLPHNGPLGWWHRLLGINRYSEALGSGIHIGVVDTGVGPHANLQHVRTVGAFVDGSHDSSPGSGHDVAEHGTHVAGIIAARSAATDRGDFAGIAPGADVVAARVYRNDSAQPGTEPPTTNNGDVAAAIDALASDETVDIINLSLGGSRGSEIENDAVQAAIDRGVLVVCAAGNGSGAPVMYPAAYPGTVAVSAFGLLGTVPPSSADAFAVPQDPVRFGAGGIYSAVFNSLGPQVACAGPGVGIISTVPKGSNGYAAMSGTSMACPAVCGALATILAGDSVYRNMTRDRSRAVYAWSMLLNHLRPLGLAQEAGAGYGLVSAVA